MTEPLGIMEITQAKQKSCLECSGHDTQCTSCGVIQLAVEAGWRGALDRMRWLQGQGITVDLLPGGQVAGGIGG